MPSLPLYYLKIIADFVFPFGLSFKFPGPKFDLCFVLAKFMHLDLEFVSGHCVYVSWLLTSREIFLNLHLAYRIYKFEIVFEVF